VVHKTIEVLIGKPMFSNLKDQFIVFEPTTIAGRQRENPKKEREMRVLPILCVNCPNLWPTSKQHICMLDNKYPSQEYKHRTIRVVVGLKSWSAYLESTGPEFTPVLPNINKQDGSKFAVYILPCQLPTINNINTLQMNITESRVPTYL
jgi:hypothetical protein